MMPQCDCKERHAAEKEGRFIHDQSRDGWVFTEGPYRRMTFSAVYFESERGLENHNGEPYVWTCCFSCGLDLPSPSLHWRVSDGEGQE